jgi:hypothetical protein
MSYYRIDRRDFTIGDIITPNAAFINNIKLSSLEIEELLENLRPETKPNRNEIIKLFDSFIAAKKYWILDPNSKFYEVEIEEADILHRGNYNLVERLYKEKDNEARIQIARQYWNDELVDCLIIENFVVNAIVSRIICNDENIRQNTKRASYNTPTIPYIGILEDE